MIFENRLAGALKLSSISSFIVGIYSLTFPEHRFKTLKKDIKKLFPAESLAVIKKTQVIIILILGFLVSVVDKYYYYGASPYLKHIGISEKYIMSFLSFGQIPEILVMWFIGFIIIKFGYKKVLITGIAFQCFRFLIFSTGNSIYYTIIGILAHGFTYSLIFVPFSIYLDSHCSEKARSGVHQVFAMINAGLASFAGNFLAGLTAAYYIINTETKEINYRFFWLTPFIISCVIMVVIVIFFKEKLKEKVIFKALSPGLKL